MHRCFSTVCRAVHPAGRSSRATDAGVAGPGSECSEPEAQPCDPMFRNESPSRVHRLRFIAVGVVGPVPRVASQRCSSSGANASAVHGPDNGHLVIVGGGMSAESGIVAKMIELGGGTGAARVVVIPTAGLPTDGSGDASKAAEKMVKMFKAEGAASVDVLHTVDRKLADTDAFVAPIRDATVVFFGGGRQWKIFDAFADTKVQTEVNAMLSRGGVVGGSSAGASIMGEHMARGDTATNFTMLGDHQVGFGLLSGASIDQHVLARKPTSTASVCGQTHV